MDSAPQPDVSRLYTELRSVAEARIRRGFGGSSLQATALVHEVWLKMAQDPELVCHDSAHFHAIAAQAMRWILIDHARRRSAARRRQESMAEALLDAQAVQQTLDPSARRTLRLEAAMQALESSYPRKAEVVMLRHYAGLSIEETAAAMNSSTATVKRDWTFARAWLMDRIQRSEREESRPT